MKTVMKRKPTEEVTSPSKEKDHMIFIRLPDALSKRFVHQSKRLACSMSTLARMAIIKFLEEEESKEKPIQS